VRLGLLVNGTGLGLAMVIIVLSRRKKKTSTLNQETSSLTEPLLSESFSSFPASDHDDSGSDINPMNSSSSGLSPMFWSLSLSCCLVVYGCVLPFNNVASAILLKRNYFQTSPMDCTLLFPHECTFGTLQDHPNPSTDSNGQACPGKNYDPVLPTLVNISVYNEDTNH
jgi:hypothetical protein